MQQRSSRLSLRARLLRAGVALSVIPLGIVAGLILQQNTTLGTIAGDSLQDLASSDLDHTVSGVYSVCETQQEVLQDFVAKSLNVARKNMAAAGEVYLNPAESVSWNAVNQYTQEMTPISLPKMQFAGRTSRTTPSCIAARLRATLPLRDRSDMRTRSSIG